MSRENPTYSEVMIKDIFNPKTFKINENETVNLTREEKCIKAIKNLDPEEFKKNYLENESEQNSVKFIKEFLLTKQRNECQPSILHHYEIIESILLKNEHIKEWMKKYSISFYFNNKEKHI